MVQASSAVPAEISLHFLPDGRVGLQLVSAPGYECLDLQVLHVEDTTAITDLIHGWAAGRHGEPKRSHERLDRFPEHRDAYGVALSTTPTAGLWRFSTSADVLSREFASAFGLLASDGPDHVRRFADHLAWEMKTFFFRSRRRAQERLAGGAYLSVLEAYLTHLRGITAPEDQEYSRSLADGIGGIMDDEQYLMLSSDARARELYLQIRAERRALNNWYMNLAKGGFPSAR